MGSWYEAQADLKLMILLPQLPKCWDSRLIFHLCWGRWRGAQGFLLSPSYYLALVQVRGQGVGSSDY
jgi:hypothetical protein